MDQQITELVEQIKVQQEKIDKMFRSVERLRKYFQWTLILTVVFVLLPFVGLIFVIPQFLNTISAYSSF